MAKPKPEEVAKLKERIANLSDDEREAMVEALEPDIIKTVKGLLKGAVPPEPEPEPKPKPKPPAKRPWWDIFGEGE